MDDGVKRSVDTANAAANVAASLSRDKQTTSVYVLQADPDINYVLPPGRLAVVFIGFMLSFMLVSLDQTILATALATIASSFSAVSDLSWIASAYFLTQAGLCLFFGQVLAVAPAKPVYLCCIALFEIGSLICAVSPSIGVLIFGRALSGVGGAGMWVSILSVLAQITTITQRPVLLGVFGGVYAVASIIGPLLGGVFSQHVTWRWCFWINLPCGGVALLIVFLVLPNNPPAASASSVGRGVWSSIDYLGAFLTMAMATMLLIPLQWGGNERPWNDPVVIALLILSGVLLVVFIAWEYKMDERALMPLNIAVSGSIPGTCVESFFSFICLVIGTYYLPLYYQVDGHSATRSGIDILPYMLSGVASAAITGGFVSVTGYLWPLLVFPPLAASVANGLIYTVHADTNSANLVGYQLLLGFGLGAVLQNTLVVAQAQYAHKPDLVPQATSLVMFLQLLGSSVGLAVSGAVFAGRLNERLSVLAPDLPPSLRSAVRESVTVIFTLPEDTKAPVITAYLSAVNSVFLIGVACAAIASFAALFISRKRIKMQNNVVVA